MSLAPPPSRLRDQNPRLSSVLPGITCSSCAAQIPLGYLGEHVCAGSSGSSSSNGGQQAETRPRPQRQASSRLQVSAHPQQSPASFESPLQHSVPSLTTLTASSLSSRVATPLKIDLGAVSNWGEGKKQGQIGGGEAGMAGVGRRGFGMDYDGKLLAFFARSLKVG